MPGSDGRGRSPRAGQIARQIEAEIVRRDWPIGASLGSEQALQDQYGVNRGVLREAVRLVEHHRVARMRRGPGGGLFVTVPDVEPASRAVVSYLEYLGTTTEELLSARLLLEPLAAQLAAERVDESGIVRLRSLAVNQSVPDEFHGALAGSTGNALLELFVDVLARLTARHTPADRLGLDHVAIVEAITAGDAAQAKTLTAERVRAVTGRPTREHRADTDRDADPVAGKRAEMLAASMRADIAAAGWQVGAVMGSEPDLLQRYGVSRAVLRESVRLLEYHGVARMRRGAGGGLMVTEPRPDAAVAITALYLDYRRPSRADLQLVRDVIELDNVATVVARRTEGDVVAFLASHQAESPVAQVDPAHSGGVEFDFHNGIAVLAGNRVCNLFLHILGELSRRHRDQARPMPGMGDVAEMYRAHARIAAAIAEGDLGMAQHRSRRHLEALSSWL